MSLLSRLAVQAARAYGILSSADKTKVVSDYLVVAGGGGGGGGYGTGGGGAGGYKTSTATLSTLNTYSITVGAGGNGGSSSGAIGSNGSDSIVSGTGLTTITSTGGGGGGRLSNGSNGGSGGGGGGRDTVGATTGGTGISGQGNNGGNGGYFAGGYYSGGGGGGASAVGSTGAGAAGNTPSGGNGGNGTASSISGSSVTYAGGGGGSAWDSVATRGTGGTGGGGNGGGSGSNTGTAGTTNTGGGGGGSGGATAGAAGGSGIVIISYTSATPKFVGGTITTSGGKQIHTFTSSGTLSPITPITASYLVVAGGGSGGSRIGGGGGAGGLLTSSTTLYSGATYVVTVGAGGASVTSTPGTNGNQGSSSSLSGTGLTTITATGGGYGGAYITSTGQNGGNGGSGGGAAGFNGGLTGGSGTSGQGFAGGNAVSSGEAGGGGGGSSAVGSNGGSGSGGVGGAGGAGTASSITGSSITYAGGGGGSGSGGGGAGGSGGGGAGSASTTNATPGTANTGGGGGGARNTIDVSGVVSGSGGSGVVIISYAGSQAFNGGLVTSSGGNTIHTFTSTGALTPLTNNLNNSLRFRSSASAFLNRTPTATGNQKTFTWSGWVKRGALGSQQMFHHAFYGDSARYSSIYFTSSDTLAVQSGVYSTGASTTTSYLYITTQVFRDPSAWYHIVVAVDTTQATSGNRVKVYVNGNQVSAFGTSTAPTQNDNTFFNITTTPMYVGKYAEAPGSSFLDGYLADINWVDGQALEPYYFGNNDANGVWKPILYKGTYGTNGFYLTFGNTTSTTTLGYDSSPNGNNWTTNNISLTAGTTYDAMTDVPTNTSATVANYCVLNPLSKAYQVSATLSGANLNISASRDTYGMGSIAIPTSGKWYWEFENTGGVVDTFVGLGTNTTSSIIKTGVYKQGSTTYIYKPDGSGAFTPTSGITGGTGVYQVAYDVDNNKIWFGFNNTWVNSGDPAAGTNASNAQAGNTFSVSAYEMFILVGNVSPGGSPTTTVGYLNHGQRPFSYTPPTGFNRLNTYNLPTPTILQGNKYMDATLYTGNGTTNVIVNQAQFQPDFVWGKSRSLANSHILSNSVAGATKFLISNSTAAEGTNAQAYASFNSNGFTLGTDTSLNSSGATNVAWQWQAGQGSTSSNTNGARTSTTSVNATAGFSVVTWTGSGSGATTVGHGLGVAPAMIIVKDRSLARNWNVYHQSLGATKGIVLNATGAASGADAGWWNNTAPTSSVFTVGTYANEASTYVAYCWAEIAGFSRFGSYVGNGSADGSFIFTNFAPKFVIIKRSDSGNSWFMIDTVRQTYNVIGPYLTAEGSGAEATGTSWIDVLSNGFKLRSSLDAWNANGGTYIFMAFASNPFKNSNAR